MSKPLTLSERHLTPRCAVWGLSLLPLGLLVGVLWRYYVDVPTWDCWWILPLVERSFQGTFGIRDLWHPVIEHRLVVPILLFLAWAHWTRWNTAYQIALNVLLGLGIFLVLAIQIRRTAQALGIPRLTWVLPAISLTVFALHQYNWLVGTYCVYYLNTLGALATIVLLTTPGIRWHHVMAALLFGGLATYSFANGLLLWPLGWLLLFWGSSSLRAPTRRRMLAVWVGVGILVTGTYLAGNPFLTQRALLWTWWQLPGRYVAYVGAFLGAPLFPSHWLGAFFLGVLGLGLWGVAVWRLRVSHRLPGFVLLPYVAMGLYAIGSATLAGIGRSRLGVTQALRCSYVTVASLLWLTLLVFLALHLQRSRPPLFRGRHAVALALFLGITSAIGGNSLWAIPQIRQYAQEAAQARAWLLSPTQMASVPPPWQQLFHSAERLEILRRRRLSVFRGSGQGAAMAPR